MSDLNPAEMLRYSRHFPVIGIQGQKQLKKAKVLCVGAGGLGCPALQYLAAAGVGTLGIIDGDTVDLSNLQRQILFAEADLGQHKAAVAAKRLTAMNSELEVVVYPYYFSKVHAEIFHAYDVILDATDNYEARYALNDLCRFLQKPLISASIYQFDAQISVFNYQDGPCYQCLYPEPPPPALTPNCSVGGVLGVLPGVAGTLQAAEAIKIILGYEDNLSGRLLCFDLKTMRFNQFTIPKQNCAEHPMVFAKEKQPETISLTMTPQELKQLQESEGSFQLIDVRQAYEREICHIGGELIPLHELDAAIHQLDKNKLIVFYCKSGVRSASAVKLCLEAGFQNVRHLEGGVLRWQETIDPQLIRY